MLQSHEFAPPWRNQGSFTLLLTGS
jgi:hypothetical protein